MPTEEDTFNRLKRLPLNQMSNIISNINKNNDWAILALGCEFSKQKKIVEENGWTLEEYNSTVEKLCSWE